MVRDLDTFIAGLEALTITGVTMLDTEPTTAPDASELPIAWVDLPMLIGGPPKTLENSAIRPERYKAAIFVALAPVVIEDRIAYTDALRTYAKAVQNALDAATFMRLEYQIALNKKIGAAASGSLFYGIVAVVTGGDLTGG